MHMAELADFAQEGVAQNRFIYLTSLDIQGAFDFVPHAVLLRELQALRVSPIYLSYVETWLSRRSFRVRLRSSTGCLYSGGTDPYPVDCRRGEFCPPCFGW